MTERVSDSQLLRRYRAGDESAFAEIVARYAGVVHGACLRVLGSETDAQDTSQATFLILARKAAKLGNAARLGAWLHRTARLAALDARKLRARRKRHEEEAATMVEAQRHTGPGWADLAPHVDAAVASLPEAQREAIVLRYGRGLSEEQVAAEMGLKRSTAAMRIGHALERLRGRLSRAGVALSAAGLAGLLAEGLGAPAPAGLAAAIAAACAGGGAAASAAAAQIAGGTVKAMAVAKMKMVACLVCAATAVGAGGTLAVRELIAEERGLPAPAVEPLDLGSVELKHVQQFIYKKEEYPALLVAGQMINYGPYLFVNGEHASQISTFRREAKTDRLEYLGAWNYEPDFRAVNKLPQHTSAFWAPGRDGVLYLTGHQFHAGNHSYGLHWYRIDGKTGAARHLGAVETSKIGIQNEWGHIVSTRDGRNLYLFGRQTRKLYWYRLGDDGRPALAGELQGKGLITYEQTLPTPSPGVLSADEKFIYSASDQDKALCWLSVGQDGKPAHAGALDLVQALGLNDDEAASLKPRGLTCTGDGRHLYMGYMIGAMPKGNRSVRYALFKLDRKSGEAAFVKKLDLGELLHKGRMVLTPCGRGAFLWTGSELKYLSRDAETGDLKTEKRCGPIGMQRNPISMNCMLAAPSGRTCYVAEGLNMSKAGVGGELHVFSLVGK